MEKQFATSDIWTAAYLQYRGLPPQLENKNGRVLFIFPHNDNLYKLIAAFNMGDSIPISEYISTFKELKVRMFQTRGAK